MESLYAVVSSDIHYTADQNGAELILPLIRKCDEAMGAFSRQIISMRPDVLILTGDHTASGKPSDRSRFSAYLRNIREHGIEIIMTTGNHDFDRCTQQEYVDIYGPFLKMDEKDPASLSYTRTIKNITFLSMDDYFPRTEGRFSEQTMEWLQKQLETAAERGTIPVFLSHHNVFHDAWTGNSRFYQIQNPGLIPLLERYNVKLALTGHQHFPAARRNGDLTEIIVPMPFQGEYTFGTLHADKDRFIWQTDQIDFARYASDRFFAAAQKLKNESSSFRLKAILPEPQRSGSSSREMYDFLESWFRHMNRGTLGRLRNDILDHPCYPDLLKQTESTAYGGWIRQMTEEGIPCDHIEIPY